MKNDTTNSDADALSKGAEERKQGDGESDVGLIATSLDGESEAGKEEAETDAVDEVNHDPFSSGGVDIKEGHKANADGCDDPSGPEGPAVVADFGDDDPADDGGGDHGEGLGEGGDAGPYGREVFDGFVVEGEVI